MPRAQQAQLNIRSAFARARANALAKLTGMTTTQVVEDALRGYVPAGGDVDVGGETLVRNGRVWVIPAKGRTVTLDEANAALDAVRSGEEDD